MVESAKGPIAKVVFQDGERVEHYRAFFDLIMEAPAATLALEKQNITDEFFVLRTGLAGEVLQKISNYQRRLVILGDFGQVESQSLRDFIFESNRTGKVVFTDSLAKAIELLR